MGPLEGMKVVELIGIGPGPFCGMLLADMGADVVGIDRLVAPPFRRSQAGARRDLTNRGQRSVAVDLKQQAGVEVVLRMIEEAEALIDPFRPGVMERLGLGPEECLKRNPRLVYGRMTGWGQTGPLAHKAGHDINFIALNGVLDMIGRAGEPPVPPLNLVGDFGGGAMFLAVGLLAGVLHARSTGEGQVVDAAMVDGAALLATMMHTLREAHGGLGPRGTNSLDTGAPSYDVYATADEKFVSVGAVESQFYEEVLRGLDLPDEQVAALTRIGRGEWPAAKKRLAEVFRTRTRAQWEERFKDRDACVTPVLTLDEAFENEHLRGRMTYRELFGVRQPSPAPRFSKTPSSVQRPPFMCGEHSREALLDWGLPLERVDDLIGRGVVVQAGSAS